MVPFPMCTPVSMWLVAKLCSCSPEKKKVQDKKMELEDEQQQSVKEDHKTTALL